MTHQLDQKFLNAIESLKKYGIKVKPKGVGGLYADLNLYQQDRNNPEYPLYLVLRELGNKTYLPVDKVDEQLSDDISTIVLEDYFSESKDQTLTHIINEIIRISKGNLDCEVLEESQYSEESGETAVTIKFTALGSNYELTHEDVYENGSLFEGFLTDALLPALKGCISNGHLLYHSEEFINFIYFSNEEDFQKFKEDFNYFKEL